MERGKDMAWGVFDDLLYVVHDTEIVDEDDWREFLAYAHRQPKINGIIVLGLVVKPDANQRNDVRELHSRFHTKLAIITTSKLTMGVLTALRWFGIPIKGFGPDQLREAHTFIDREDMLGHSKRLLAPYRAGGKSGTRQA